MSKGRIQHREGSEQGEGRSCYQGKQGDYGELEEGTLISPPT